ncbi:MAG: YchJ family metal-binding protein [Campylobacterota bacterium]|nr:YchJ family metal-binding protein [Campylobacterota bacterium]
MNPEELMRSRYDAFVREDWEYLVETSLHQSLDELKSSPAMDWLKLDVINADDDFVEFKAYYRDNETVSVLHEKSNFVLVDGVWKYKDGVLYSSRVERNEACPCESGKKFKKCCAK